MIPSSCCFPPLPFLSEGRDALDDKKKWKQMQVLMNDSVKFIEMLYNIDWENGLPPSVVTNVEMYLPAKKEGEGVTGEGSLLDLPGKGFITSSLY